MMVLTDCADVLNLCRPVLGKRLDMMKLYLMFILNAMVVYEAVKESVPPLLRENGFLLGFGNLSLK
jgi:hypothetical protein